MVIISIVTFNARIDAIRKLINNIQNQEYIVLIVDNASKNQNILKESLDNEHNVVFVPLEQNFGIAYAQNVAIKYAIDQKSEFILFFDQDSSIDHLLVKNLINEFEVLSRKNNIAAIGPRFIDENKGFYFPALKFNSKGLIDKIPVEEINEPIEVSFLISSGTLVSVEALKDIGLMREEFFIDFVDTEWCFRALSKGYQLYMSKNAVMKHSIGDDTLKILNFKIPVHSGFRRYYRVRNLFFMWKMPYIPKILTAKLMFTNFAIQVLLFLLKDKKYDYIKYYLKAINDGIKQSKNYKI